MVIQTEEFDKVNEFSGVEKLQREVKTPSSDDNNSYRFEENSQTVYSVDDVLVKVSKVSDLGWSVTHYSDSGETLESIIGPQFNEEDEAHQKAEEIIRNIFDSDNE